MNEKWIFVKITLYKLKQSIVNDFSCNIYSNKKQDILLHYHSIQNTFVRIFYVVAGFGITLKHPEMTKENLASGDFKFAAWTLIR